MCCIIDNICHVNLFMSTYKYIEHGLENRLFESIKIFILIMGIVEFTFIRII